MQLINISAAEMILYRLQALGVEFIFINSGTDYPPMVEAYSRLKSEGRLVPEFVVCPHENAAIGMAHGYYLATGKVQAVMVHTNVGLANAACGIINLANSNIPVIILAGARPSVNILISAAGIRLSAMARKCAIRPRWFVNRLNGILNCVMPIRPGNMSIAPGRLRTLCPKDRFI